MASKVRNNFDFKVFGRLIGFAKKYKIRFLIASVSTILLAISVAGTPYVIIQAIDDFTVTKNLKNLQFYTILMFVILLVQVVLQFSYIYFASWVGQHVVKDIREQTFTKIINFKNAYFDNNAVGRLVTRVVSDIETIANFFTQGVFMVISDLLKMLVILVFMFFVNWRLSLIVLAILPILLYATRLFQKAIKKTFQEVRNQVSNLNGFVQERVTGMKIVQLFNREKIEYNNFVSINQKHKQAYIKTVWYYSIFFPITEILSSIAIGLVVWYGGLQIIAGDFVTVGAVIGFIRIAQMLFRPLRQIADKFNQLQMGIVAGERVFEVIDTDSSINKNGTLSASKIKGDIIFDEVSFSYVPNQQVLKGISFEVSKGETIALVGATGAGKSTIINLISRFYELDKGVIKVDNHPVEDYDIVSLRKSVAVVLQDVFLFSDTIFNNITLYDTNITKDEVVKAAKLIGVHEFIMSLPNDYNYNVKERGMMLSSGQRQLIAFLRAYVTNPSILILDEATSSVDTHTEKMIQHATNMITKNRTSIIVAHRLATIKKADKIIVMDNGEIVEVGNHKSLLDLKEGYYTSLYQKQFSAK